MVAWYGQLNYVASCWSSTTEGASDVSPSHLFTLPTARAVSLLCWVVLFVLFLLCLVHVLHVQQASF